MARFFLALGNTPVWFSAPCPGGDEIPDLDRARPTLRHGVPCTVEDLPARVYRGIRTFRLNVTLASTVGPEEDGSLVARRRSRPIFAHEEATVSFTHTFLQPRSSRKSFPGYLICRDAASLCRDDTLQVPATGPGHDGGW